jgi:hypothetical protein
MADIVPTFAAWRKGKIARRGGFRSAALFSGKEPFQGKSFPQALEKKCAYLFLGSV